MLSNLAEIKTVCSPRTLDVSADLMNMYLDYITEFHMDEVDTNHVFIKISGENRYQPLEYGDITSLFKRLCTKTGIQVNLVHAPWKREAFLYLEEAEKDALDKAKEVALERAHLAGVVNPELLVEKEEVLSHTAGGDDVVFLETRIEVTAIGHPTWEG